MGLPYSKQINAAFDQVTPLVAAGFQVLQTTKNISILLAAIQVLTAILLLLILMTLLALLITMNPDLENERRTLVTPLIKWFACWMMPNCQSRSRVVAFFWFMLAIIVFTGAWAWFSASTDVEQPGQSEEELQDDDDKNSNESEKSESEKSKK